MLRLIIEGEGAQPTRAPQRSDTMMNSNGYFTPWTLRSNGAAVRFTKCRTAVLVEVSQEGDNFFSADLMTTGEARAEWVRLMKSGWGTARS